MKIQTKFGTITGIVLIALVVLVFSPDWKDNGTATETVSASYIVQAASLEQALGAVQKVGGEITHELRIINAVGARLSSAQRIALDADPQIRTYVNSEAQVASYVWADPILSSEPYVEKQYGKVVGSPDVHSKGIDGRGVTVAIIDTGLWWGQQAIRKNSANEDRILARYDAIADELVDLGTNNSSNDGNGHGTHLSSIALNSDSHNGEYIGIGEPKHADGAAVGFQPKIDALRKKLENLFPSITVVYHNEAFSSQKAKQIIMQSGAKKKKRRDKRLIDKISAVVILQDYLGHLDSY